jgi:hypothetical protein
VAPSYGTSWAASQLNPLGFRGRLILPPYAEGVHLRSRRRNGTLQDEKCILGLELGNLAISL